MTCFAAGKRQEEEQLALLSAAAPIGHCVASGHLAPSPFPLQDMLAWQNEPPRAYNTGWPTSHSIHVIILPLLNAHCYVREIL